MARMRITPSISEGKRRMIGTICIEWSMLEFYVQRTVAVLSGKDTAEHKRQLETFDTNRWRKQLQKEAKKLINTEDKNILLSVVDGIKQWQPERNLVVHGYWSLDEAGRLHTVTFRKGPLKGAQPMTYKRMNNLYLGIGKLVIILHVFLRARESARPS